MSVGTQGVFHLGVDSWSLHNSLEQHIISITDFFRLVHSLGFRCVQYNPLRDTYKGCGLSRLNEQRALLEDLGMIPIVNDYRSLLASQLSKCVVDGLRERCEAACALGASLVSGVLTTTDQNDMKSFGGDRRSMVECAIRSLHQVASIAAEMGLVYLIENHGDFTGSELKEIIQGVGSPYIGVTLDTGNQVEVFDDPYETAKLLMPLTKAVHFKNYGFEITHFGGILYGSTLRGGLLDMERMCDIIGSGAEVEVFINVEVACREASEEVPFTESYVEFLRRRFVP